MKNKNLNEKPAKNVEIALTAEYMREIINHENQYEKCGAPKTFKPLCKK